RRSVSPRRCVGGARRLLLLPPPVAAIVLMPGTASRGYLRWPPRFRTVIHWSFAALQAAAADEEPLRAAANCWAASVISSNVSGMFAISRILARALAWPAALRYGN